MDQCCIYCGQTDTVEHTIVECMRWKEEELKLEMDERVNIKRLVEWILKSKIKLTKTSEYLRRIIKDKEREERERESQGKE